MTWAHNTMTDILGASFTLADSLESVIEDNTLTNSGAGIYISAFGPYGGPASYGPVINTDVLRNTLSVGAGTDIWDNPQSNYSGIGVQDMPGCLVSGLMVRDNLVPAQNTIFGTNGVNGVSACNHRTQSGLSQFYASRARVPAPEQFTPATVMLMAHLKDLDAVVHCSTTES